MKNEPRHDFKNDEWKIKYAKPPKRETERRIRISGGKARLNFGRASSSFSAGRGGLTGNKFSSGMKTWSVSVMAKVVSGAKNKGRSGAFAAYIERQEECLASYGDIESKKKFNELDEKLLSDNPKRVIQEQLVIPVPKEWLLNPDELTEKFGKLLEEKYFDVCYAYNIALHQGGDDFKNPHLHVIFSTVDRELKNIRDFNRANKAFLPEVKEDVRGFISKELAVNAVLKEYKKNKEIGGIKHYPKWVANAYKRAEEAEKQDGGKMMKEYASKYPVFQEYLSERRRKKLERGLSEELEKAKEILGKQDKILKTLKKSLFITRAGKEIITNELEKEVKEENKTMCNFWKDKEKILAGQKEGQDKENVSEGVPGQEKKQERNRELHEIKKEIANTENLKVNLLDDGRLLVVPKYTSLYFEYNDPGAGEENQARNDTLNHQRIEGFRAIFPEADFSKELGGFVVPADLEKLGRFQNEDDKLITKARADYGQELHLTEHKREMRRQMQKNKNLYRDKGGFER